MTINNKGVLPALGLGMAAGAILGMMSSSGKGQIKRDAAKAVRAVGDAVEQTIEDAADMFRR